MKIIPGGCYEIIKRRDNGISGALQKSRPELSKALIKIVNEEKIELKGEQKEDKEETEEENEIKDKK